MLKCTPIASQKSTQGLQRATMFNRSYKGWLQELFYELANKRQLL